VRISFSKAPPVLVTASENVYAFSAPAGVLAKLKRIFRGTFNPGKTRHLSKKQRHRREVRLQRAFFKLLHEGEPTKIEWLDPGGALVRLIRPQRRNLLGSSIVTSG
jgi:hypothetical protein